MTPACETMRRLPSTIGEAIHAARGADGTLEALVLTTFAWSPRAAEREILPWLIAGRAVGDEARSDRFLTGLLGQVEHGVSLFYDARAFASPTQRDEAPLHGVRIQHVPVHLDAGSCFHPKLILALVRKSDGTQALVVVTSSANLTKAAWLTNLEMVDVDTLVAGEAHGLAAGLREATSWLAGLADNAVASVQAVSVFLQNIGTPPTAQQRSAFWFSRTTNDEAHPLLKDVRARLGASLASRATLELSAPFATRAGLSLLLEQLPANALRIRAPTNEKGAPNAGADWLELLERNDITWCDLPVPTFHLDRSDIEHHRFAHAKLLRWVPDSPGDIGLSVVGSPNHTRAALDGTNVEAAVLRWGTGGEHAEEWLKETEAAPMPAEAPKDTVLDELGGHSVAPLRLRVRWVETVALVEARPLQAEMLPVHVDVMPRAVPISGDHGVRVTLARDEWWAVPQLQVLSDELISAPTRYIRPAGSVEPGVPVLTEIEDGHLHDQRAHGAPSLGDLLASFLHDDTFRRVDKLLERTVPANTDDGAPVETSPPTHHTREGTAFGQLARTLMSHLAFQDRLAARDLPGAFLVDIYDAGLGWRQVLTQLASQVDDDSTPAELTEAIAHGQCVLELLDWVDKRGLVSPARRAVHDGMRADAEALLAACWPGLSDVDPAFRAWFERAWRDPEAP